MPSEKELTAKATQLAEIIYGFTSKTKPWHIKSDDPLDFTNGTTSISFSKKEPGRVLIFSESMGSRMKNGPKQGEKFRTQDEWERHGFQQIAKVWNDIDGYVGEFRKVGERSFTVQGHKSWDSDSNRSEEHTSELQSPC